MAVKLAVCKTKWKKSAVWVILGDHQKKKIPASGVDSGEQKSYAIFRLVQGLHGEKKDQLKTTT